MPIPYCIITNPPENPNRTTNNNPNNNFYTCQKKFYQAPIEIEKRVVGQMEKGGAGTKTLNLILPSRLHPGPNDFLFNKSNCKFFLFQFFPASLKKILLV